MATCAATSDRFGRPSALQGMLVETRQISAGVDLLLNAKYCYVKKWAWGTVKEVMLGSKNELELHQQDSSECHVACIRDLQSTHKPLSWRERTDGFCWSCYLGGMCNSNSAAPSPGTISPQSGGACSSQCIRVKSYRLAMALRTDGRANEQNLQYLLYMCANICHRRRMLG